MDRTSRCKHLSRRRRQARERNPGNRLIRIHIEDRRASLTLIVIRQRCGAVAEKSGPFPCEKLCANSDAICTSRRRLASGTSLSADSSASLRIAERSRLKRPRIERAEVACPDYVTARAGWRISVPRRVARGVCPQLIDGKALPMKVTQQSGRVISVCVMLVDL